MGRKLVVYARVCAGICLHSGGASIIQNIREPVVGADIVECNLRHDPLGITAMAAAKFVKEIAASMIESN